MKESDFALLYGIMLGDGCLSKYVTKEGRERQAICITGDYYGDREFYTKIVKPLLIRLGRKSVSIKSRPKNGTLEINFPDRVLFNKFVESGFSVGKKGTLISIPKFFFKGKFIVNLIQGLFATDGSLVLTKNPNKFYPRLEIHLISNLLLSQIKKVLIKKGINTNLYKCKRKKRDKRWKRIQDQYRIQINGKKNLIMFENLIGFINPKHRKRFEDFMKYSQKYDLIKEKDLVAKFKVNEAFFKIVAAPRVELGTSSS